MGDVNVEERMKRRQGQLRQSGHVSDISDNLNDMDGPFIRDVPATMCLFTGCFLSFCFRIG